jgi:hypothetical protein
MKALVVAAAGHFGPLHSEPQYAHDRPVIDRAVVLFDPQSGKVEVGADIGRRVGVVVWPR